MKQCLSLLLAAWMALSFAACAKTEPAEATAALADETAAATEAPALTAAPNELDAIKAAGKITVATSPDFAPVEFVDLSKSGQEAYVGADIALAKYIAEKLGVELVIEAMDFSAVQAAVTQNKVDLAISGFAWTEERAQSMELSTYYNKEEDQGQLLLVKKGEAQTYAAASDFSGKRVAAQNASLQYSLTETQLPDATIEPIANLNDAILMLTTGKVDAVACSGDVAEGYCANYPDIELATFHFDSSSEGNVLAGTKGETALMEAVNAILDEVNEKGLYKTWLEEAKALATQLGVEY